MHIIILIKKYALVWGQDTYPSEFLLHSLLSLPAYFPTVPGT